MNRYGGSKEFRRGVRLMLPIAVSDLLEGVAFGALAVTVLGHVAPVAMSLTAFSGSAQFATVAVLRSDGTLMAALLAAASLNVRYLAMSASVATRISGSRRRKAATCLLLTDAAWAVVTAGEEEASGARLAGAGATELAAWSGGTLIGVLAGGVVGDHEAIGLDAAFPAFFAWLLLDRLRDRAAAVAALAGGALALALSPLLSPGLPILAAGLAAAAWGARR
jgi:predicted branched-subunit amino acid permease